MEDAVDDDMDIVSFSIGSAAFTGAVDSGAACGLPDGVPCDLSALAFENAGKAEVTIVVAAGNTGQDGSQYPSYNTISSPAHAPSVIAVGATSNSHYFAETVSVSGSGVPAGLQNIAAAFGDALIPADPVTAPLVDVTRLGNDGLACSSLPAGSLNGSFALILRGTCFFSDKVTNAVAAGAAGVIFYNSPGSDFVSPAGLTSFLIPVVMISDTDGVALKSFIAANPGRAVTIDPVGEREWPTPNQLIEFSGRGPSTGDSGIKPELVAPGVDMYMAAAKLRSAGDPLQPEPLRCGQRHQFLDSTGLGSRGPGEATSPRLHSRPSQVGPRELGLARRHGGRVGPRLCQSMCETSARVNWTSLPPLTPP